MKTGISTLDQMLGGKGIPDGSIVLLRGGPGTGKTTLALQIAANHLAAETMGVNNFVIFTSLELPPERAVKNFQALIPDKRSFFDPNETPKKYMPININKFYNTIDKAIDKTNDIEDEVDKLIWGVRAVGNGWSQISIAIEARKMSLGNWYRRKHRWDVPMGEVLQTSPWEWSPSDGKSSYT